MNGDSETAQKTANFYRFMAGVGRPTKSVIANGGVEGNFIAVCPFDECGETVRTSYDSHGHVKWAPGQEDENTGCTHYRGAYDCGRIGCVEMMFK